MDTIQEVVTPLSGKAVKDNIAKMDQVELEIKEKATNGENQMDKSQADKSGDSRFEKSLSVGSDEVFAGQSTGSQNDDVVESMKRSESASSHMSTQSIVSSIEEESDSPLIAAVKRFDVKTVKVLLEDVKEDVNEKTKKGYTCLHEMIRTYTNMNIVDKMMNRKHLDELVVFLAQRGLDVNAMDKGKKKQTALHIIAEYDGNDDIIKMLLAVGSRVNIVNAEGETALHKAVKKVNAINSEALLEGGTDPNIRDKNGQSALHLAAKGPRHLVLLQLLIKCGADTELTDKGGRLPIHIASKAGRADLVRELIIGGSSINTNDLSGQSPLHLAAAHDITGLVIRELVDRPALKLNEKDAIYGETALHKIIRMRMLENLKVIAARDLKIRINSRDDNGDTALHKAAVSHEIVVWKTLLQLKGEPNLLNNDHLTPLDLAMKAKNNVAIALINQYVTEE